MNAILDLYNVPSIIHVKWNLLDDDVSKLPLTFDSISVSLFLKHILNLLSLDPTPQYSILTSYSSEIKTNSIMQYLIIQL